jgi:hypothetical protein
MYDRTRIARGAGTAVAVWALVGLLVMSTGVAFALPRAGIGGFNVSATEIAADQLTLYPGSADTSNTSGYPQAVVELKNVDAQNLQLVKHFNLDYYGLSGNARLVIWSRGATDGGAMLLKSSVVSANGVSFTDFGIDESNTSDVSTRLEVTSQSEVDLNDPDLRLAVCYDPDNDDAWEYGPC